MTSGGIGVPSIAVRIRGAAGTSTSYPSTVAATTTSTATASASASASDDVEKNLYGMYIQATKGEVRYQWVIFPPYVEELLSGPVTNSIGYAPLYCYIQRTQQHEGNRAKWFHMRQWPGSTPMDETLRSSFVERGYEVSQPVVVPMTLDDYKQVWDDRKTPHRYLRDVDKTLKPLGLRIK